MNENYVYIESNDKKLNCTVSKEMAYDMNDIYGIDVKKFFSEMLTIKSHTPGNDGSYSVTMKIEPDTSDVCFSLFKKN